MKNNMKHIRLIILLSFVTVLSSCNDWLVLEPEGKVVESDFWKLESDVESVVAATYRALVDDAIIARMIVYGELRSDNMVGGYGLQDNLQKIIEASILPNNPYTDWSHFYRAINFCNLVLHYAPQVVDPNFSQSQLNSKLAEVLALRALSYFYLVRAFGEVPLVLDPSIDDTKDFFVAKSPENIILDQLEQDLIVAEAWAKTSYSSLVQNKGRITKNAVRALLTDIYLWRGKYEQAIFYADKILADPLLVLTEADDDPYFEIFGKKNSKESIFELQFSRNNFTFNSSINFLYGNNDNIAGQLVVPEFIAVQNEVFVNSPQVTDIRRKDFIHTKTPTNLYPIFKYPGLNRTESMDGQNRYTHRNFQNSPANWIVYRLTDVMLMKAEALVQLEDFMPALQLVNTTYMRSNPTLSDTLSLDDFNNKEKMEELVLLERQRELMFEGKRWFDLMRMARRDGNTNRLVETVLRKLKENQSVVSSKMRVMNAMYFPINETEIATNPNLKQNPYYESKFK